MSSSAFEIRSDHVFHNVGYIVGGYALAIMAALPFARETVPVIPAVTPILIAGVLATDLTTSFLLVVWFRDVRIWSLLLLAAAYLYSGLMAFVYLLTFPKALLPGRSIIGSQQSAALTFLLWTNGYAVVALVSILLEAFGQQRCIAKPHAEKAVAIGVGATLAVVGGCAFAGTVMVDRVPLLIRGSSFTPFDNLINCIGLVTMISGIVIALVFIRGRNNVFLWLSVALTAVLFSNALALAGGGRYTIGWLLARLSMLLSAGFLFFFFMSQFARQQRHLLLARNTLEQKIEQRTAELQRTVKQRDLLLREVYHRVKNNLQVVDSLIAIEQCRVADATAKDGLSDLRNRVFTLGLVHQQLMSSDNLETFSIAPFLHELTENVVATFGDRATGLEVIVVSDPVPVDLDFAVPLGLLTTELLTNIIKHANATIVRVEFSRRGDRDAILVVGDNGDGISPGYGTPKLRAGVGSKIIDGITRQLEGQMLVFPHDGLRVEISMPLPAAA